MRQALLVSLVTVLVSSDAEANPYKGRFVRHLETWTAWRGVVHVDDLRIPVTISYEVDDTLELQLAYSVEYVRTNLEFAYRLHLDLLEEEHQIATDCAPNYGFDVYVITSASFQDRNMWKPYFDITGQHTIPLALYDTTPRMPGHSNLLFTTHGVEADFLSLQHEFAHYFWRRLCMDDIEADTEEFAQRMEKLAVEQAKLGPL